MSEKLLDRPLELELRVEDVSGLGGPEEVFGRLHHLPWSAFLDSSLRMDGYGERSFIGFDPYLVLLHRGGETLQLRRGGAAERSREHPLEAMRRVLGARRISAPDPSLPPFAGGAIGYFAYELGRYIEKLPATVVDDIGLPEMALAFYDKALAFDLRSGRSLLVVSSPGNGSKERDEAMRLLEAEPLPTRWEVSEGGPGFTSNFTYEEYLEAVRRVKEYILAGDIYQANLTQRFTTTLRQHPWDMYRRLRRVNAAPFSAYLNLGEGVICSSSPERFLKVEGRRVETRPIKGTRKRSDDPREDARLQEELLGSAKDRAELSMIVDLERNDLGRVCEYGSVKVEEHAVIESYATVHHLVSTVTGLLHEGKDQADLLRATFPGGSITGAPKIRSMEIIDELEPTARSVYTGSIGYLGFNGVSDLNIAIRTIIVRGERAYFQVGGGIVADSSPQDEYEETLHKGKALFAALSPE
jgi:para-aminobenzoate synthetase component 1